MLKHSLTALLILQHIRKIGTAATNELQALNTQRKPAVSPAKDKGQTQLQHQHELSEPPSPPKRSQQQPKQQFQHPQQLKPVVPAPDPEPLTPKSLTREFGLTAKNPLLLIPATVAKTQVH